MEYATKLGHVDHLSLYKDAENEQLNSLSVSLRKFRRLKCSILVWFSFFSYYHTKLCSTAWYYFINIVNQNMVNLSKIPISWYNVQIQFFCLTNVFSPFLYNKSLFLVYSRCYTELWGQWPKFLYIFLSPFWLNVPDFARNCSLRRQDNKFSFIFNLIIWQSYYTIGHRAVFQSSLTDLWSQNSVDPHCGQSQVMRGETTSCIHRLLFHSSDS